MSTTPLQRYLELYLTQEGLYSVIPEHRSKSIFTLPAGRTGFFLLMFTEFVFLSLFTQRIEWFAPITIALISLIVAFGTAFVYMVTVFVRTKRQINQEQTKFLGGLIMLIISLSLAIANGYYLNSWVASVLFVPWALLWFAIFAVVNQFYHRIQALAGPLKSVLTSATRSIQLIIVILPLMLILILFSVFSGEFWQAIGNINSIRLLFGVVILFTPTILLLITSVPKLSKDLVAQSKDGFFRVELVRSLPEINKPFSQGMITVEEWQEAVNQLSWMDKDKILEELIFIEKRLRSSFGWLLVFTTIFIFTSFSVYFFVLFKILVTSEQIASWTGIKIDIISFQLMMGGINYIINLLSTDFALAKVSMFLAAFVSTATLVQSLTDEAFRNIFTEQLKLRLTRWMSAASLYKAVTTPGYQIWSVIRPLRTPMVVHVIIIVPKASADDAVKRACELAKSYNNLKSYNVLRIIAFEQKEDNINYSIGMPGRKWIYVHNSTNNIVNFYENHSIIPEEPSTDHLLGDKCLSEGVEIPDKWFSEQDSGVIIGKAIWEHDTQHRLILHPRISVNDDKIVAHIHLRRKFETSQEYKEAVKQIFLVIRRSDIKFSLLLLSLTFRETLEYLANLDFNEINVMYRDGIADKYEYFSHEEWESTLPQK